MLKKRRKQIKVIFILSGIGILCVFFCVLLLRLRGGNVVRANGEDLLLKEAVAYRQDDMRWADDRLGDSAEVFADVSSTEIEECLESGNYPIVRVRVKGVGSFHYVLIVGRRDGEYLCMDPLEDNVTKLSDYGNRVYAVRLVRRDKQ